jgi:hypothetical protein
MNSKATVLCAIGMAGGLAAGLAAVEPALALTMQQCSAKYEAAKGAGTLQGMTWQQFRRANCGPGAAPLATAPTGSGAAPPLATKPTGSGSAALSPGATFPNAISPRYKSESAGKARMLTCLDQYRANKTANANGGLRWIARGGGYYSECNKRLKG